MRAKFGINRTGNEGEIRNVWCKVGAASARHRKFSMLLWRTAGNHFGGTTIKFPIGKIKGASDVFMNFVSQ